MMGGKKHFGNVLLHELWSDTPGTSLTTVIARLEFILWLPINPRGPWKVAESWASWHRANGPEIPQSTLHIGRSRYTIYWVSRRFDDHSSIVTGCGGTKCGVIDQRVGLSGLAILPLRAWNVLQHSASKGRIPRITR